MFMNFQLLIIDLTGMEIANASLLDESTAAAESMMMAFRLKNKKNKTFCIQTSCHPQTISVLKTRAAPLGIKTESSTFLINFPRSRAISNFVIFF